MTEQQQINQLNALVAAMRQQRDSALDAHAQVHANLMLKEQELQETRREASEAVQSLQTRIQELEALQGAKLKAVQ